MTVEHDAPPPLRADSTAHSPDPLPTAPPHFQGFVVAVGASAGGLEALERFFSAMPVDTGAAFVVVQHLSPDHKSMMDNLLARHTAMPVKVAEHNARLSANAVFLIPPGKTLRLDVDRLQLAPKPEHGLSLPIDIFFESLAEQRHDRAIAVVLSGTGSDGSRGVGAVHANSGFVFVQEPESAKFDGMPRSAIATGMVDAVADAAGLAERVVHQMRSPRDGALRLMGIEPTAALVEPLEGILARLLVSGGIDFRDYKHTTVLRRIERRMQVLHAPSLIEYRERLDASLEEQTLLRRELLIPVTRFFRDIEVWETLSREVIAKLVESHTAAEPLRVWVACCATGEEAYTLAILFAEAFDRARRPGSVKIFATDVEQLYVDQAALGHYPETIAAEVSAHRLERFFVAHEGGYVVRPTIRQTVIFARHNLIGDPPFTRMHLVTCRNALIYFLPEVQERALRRLQYALRTGGHLLLGPSESLGVLHRDFALVDGGHKLYELTRTDRPIVGLDSNSAHRLAARRLIGSGPRVLPSPPDPIATMVGEGQRVLMLGYSPTSLLIGPARELLHVYGDATGFLALSEGDASLDVLKLLPRDLSWAAATLLQASSVDGLERRSALLALGSGAARRTLQLVLRPVPGKGGAKPVNALLSFEFQPESAAPVVTEATVALGIDQQRHVDALERELALTHDTLQATIEELETSNEELQATNEELMASNEELQSTNEELQSVNEELYTVNSEYQEKVDILNSVNADLENMSRAASVATVFVDENLVLTRFTPEAALIFKLRGGDAGRSIEDFAHSLEYPELFTDLRRALADGTVTEREVRSRSGDWWLARLQPYADRAHAAPRAVMTFCNISSVKDSQRLQAIVDSLAEHLAVLDGFGTITMVNEAWRRYAQSHGDTELRGTGPGTNYLAICAGAASSDPTARLAYDGLRSVLEGREKSFRMQYPCHSADEKRWFLMHVAPVQAPGRGAVVSHAEVTPWMAPERATGAAAAVAAATEHGQVV